MCVACKTKKTVFIGAAILPIAHSRQKALSLDAVLTALSHGNMMEGEGTQMADCSEPPPRATPVLLSNLHVLL